MSGTSTTVAVTPFRPQYISEFLYDGIASYSGLSDPTWLRANRGRNRFYLLNIHSVLTDLGCSVNSLISPFAQANEFVRAEKTPMSPEFTQIITGGTVSHVQLDFAHRGECKLLSHAVVCVIALDIWARTNKPNYDVYEHLRILPAHYAIAGFTPKLLTEIEEYHDELSVSKRKTTFIDTRVDWDRNTSFQTIAATYANHRSHKLIKNLASGFTATKECCDALRKFINDHYPSHLHVGNVLESGNIALGGAGTGHASPELQVKQIMPINRAAKPAS